MSYDKEVSGWAIGWTGYAAVWMWILGVAHVLSGISGIAEDDIFVVTADYLYKLDVTTWGWIHLGLGILVFLAGIALLKGSVWARTVGVILAVLSTLSNFAWLPYNPIWGALMIMANAFVIWALTLHGRDITR